MDEQIIKEKTSADHLMYVSLKYTKTCDVMLNLLARWKSLIEISFDSILDAGCKKGSIPCEPVTPKERIEFIKKYFNKNEPIQKVLPLYIFFKRIPNLKHVKTGEFRKNVNLKIVEPHRETNINMEKLGEYYDTVEAFISQIKELTSEQS